jgi:hypothetical protein
MWFIQACSELISQWLRNIASVSGRNWSDKIKSFVFFFSLIYFIFWMILLPWGRGHLQYLFRSPSDVSSHFTHISYFLCFFYLSFVLTPLDFLTFFLSFFLSFFRPSLIFLSLFFFPLPSSLDITPALYKLKLYSSDKFLCTPYILNLQYQLNIFGYGTCGRTER